MIVRFGVLCDRCGAGSNDYDSSTCASCGFCERDLCDPCARATGHTLTRDGEDGEHCKAWDCEDNQAAPIA